MKKIYMRGIILENADKKIVEKNRNRNKDSGGNYVKSNHCR